MIDKSKFHRPFNVVLDVVQGCNRRCPFCALSQMPWANKPYQYMAPDLLRGICMDLAPWCPSPRLCLGNHGEPTLHPQFPELISIVRECLPKAFIMVSTNGLKYSLLKKGFKGYLDDLFERGLNRVVVDCYDRGMAEKVREVLPDAEDFFSDPKVYCKGSLKEKRVLVKDAAPDENGVYSEGGILTYINQGGNADHSAVKFSRGERDERPKNMCTAPFRRLVIRYDGSCLICCDDWRGEAVVGTFPERTTKQLWYEDLERLRTKLVYGGRYFAPCNRCNDSVGVRVGLELMYYPDRPKKRGS